MVKIAIQGHPTRGKEVIQILKSLGGIDPYKHLGNNTDCYYEIHGNTILCACIKSNKYKYYTLEEFEEEFLFKIGDKVVCKENLYASHTIIGISYNPSSCLQYEIKEDKTGIIVHYPTDLLIKYNEMKKERNVTLTLNKAKEWYKKGGELKEVALQAYSEEELTKIELPKTWEEFCDNYPVKGSEAMIGCDARILNCRGIEGKRSYKFKDIMPSKESAEAHLAMIQLEQLRDCWRQGWKPDWNDDQQSKYCIVCYQEKFKVSVRYTTNRFLSFPTIEMANEFLKCFRDLIEKAGDLI